MSAGFDAVCLPVRRPQANVLRDTNCFITLVNDVADPAGAAEPPSAPLRRQPGKKKKSVARDLTANPQRLDESAAHRSAVAPLTQRVH